MNREELKTALEIVSPGLATDDVFEQGKSFAFINGKVATYNNEVSISHPVKGLDVEGAINAKPLYELILKLKTTDIEITIKNNELLIKSGRAKAGMAIINDVELPLHKIKKNKWKDLYKEFSKEIGFVSNACSDDMLRPVLTCVEVAKKTMRASDGFKLIVLNTSDKMPTDTFLLPEKTIKLITKHQLTSIYKEENWVHFKTEKGTIISCRTFNEKFPNTEQHLIVKDGKKLSLPENVYGIINAADVFSKRSVKSTENIDISIEKKRITISSKSDDGWFEESTDIKFKGKLQFSIAPYLLTDILSRSNQCEINSEKIKFSNDDWEYIGALKAN